jgi:hypothetical protein
MKTKPEPVAGKVSAVRRKVQTPPGGPAGDSELKRRLFPLWRKASAKQFMPDIQAFADTVRAVGESQRPDLVEYAEGLSAAVRDYDVAEIVSLLERFPALPGIAHTDNPNDGETSIFVNGKEPDP